MGAGTPMAGHQTMAPRRLRYEEKAPGAGRAEAVLETRARRCKRRLETAVEARGGPGGSRPAGIVARGAVAAVLPRDQAASPQPRARRGAAGLWRPLVARGRQRPRGPRCQRLPELCNGGISPAVLAIRKGSRRPTLIHFVP